MQNGKMRGKKNRGMNEERKKEKVEKEAKKIGNGDKR